MEFRNCLRNKCSHSYEVWVFCPIESDTLIWEKIKLKIEKSRKDRLSGSKKTILDNKKWWKTTTAHNTCT